jgi:small subunit ribosomal protein S6e
MPDMKIVISDPEAKEERWFKVIFVADPSLPYGDEEKSGKKLMRGKISPLLDQFIKKDLNIVNARIWRSSTEKINFTLQLTVDPELTGIEIKVPANFMREKTGADRVIGEIKRASSFQITLSSDKAQKLYGLKIGDEIDGGLIGLPGYKLRITGGSDYSGAPMIPTLPGPGKRYLLLSQPPGFRPKEDGLRKRKLVRGNTLSEAIVQVNTVIIERPGKS